MKKFLLFLWGLVFLLYPIIADDDISVKARVDTNEVFLGEPFRFYITVKGVELPPDPDLSSIKEFSIENLGSNTGYNTSFSWINGTVTEFKEYTHNFQYRLKPLKTGVLFIPPITFDINNKSFSTNKIQILVKEPERNEDFKLEISMDKVEYYVGEPIQATVTWYITKTVQDVSFTVPLFQDPRFQIAEDSEDPRNMPVAPKSSYEISVNQNPKIVYRGKSPWKGRNCDTLYFTQVFVAKEAGTMNISPASVNFSTMLSVPQSETKHRRFFDDDLDDDFFGSGIFNRRKSFTTLKKYSVPSEPLKLRIKPLPSEGKPANFSGNVGQYGIQTSATPTEVKVGTPITLTIEIKGSVYPQFISMPDLSVLEQDFKVSKQNVENSKVMHRTIRPNVVEHSKIFTVTIRPNNDKVNQIPGIPFCYFDPRQKTYVTAESVPFDITVYPTKMITANDVQNTTISVEKKELEDFSEGIAFNYEGLDVLDNQDYDLRTLKKFPWSIFIILLPLSYLICVIALLIKHQSQHYNKQKNAYRIFCKQWEKTPQTAGNQLILLREYFGNKLNLSSGSLTWNEIEEYLPNTSIKDQLHEIFDALEASYYTGTNETEDTQLATDVKKAIDQLQSCFNA